MISEFLDKVFPLESVDESAKRDLVTREIELLANRWLQKEDPTAPSAKLLTFGSSILGVTTNESDLDTVLLFPATISREKFFESFVTMLQAEAPDTLRVESLMAIPDAHVPVLKMVIMGLPVDILPCRVPVKHLRALLGSLDPSTGQLNFNLLNYKDLDHPSLLALNGVRVGRTLVDSIRAGRVVAEDEQVSGGESRLVRFRLCLRLIKYWAQNRGIYCNALGYFGGVTWAILLVQVCVGEGSILIDTCSSEYELLSKFFTYFRSWPWGVANPISLRSLPGHLTSYLSILKQTGSDPSVSTSTTPLEEEDSEAADTVMWDPSQNEIDRKSLMPVLTPIIPYMNSTFNTLHSTSRVIADEFRRADEIMAGGATDLSQLCTPEGFDKYAAAIVLTVDATDRLLFVWESLVQSKLRVLVYHLERMEGVVCRPFPDSVENKFRIGISFVSPAQVVDFNYAIGQFHGALVTAIDTRPDGEDLKKFCRIHITLERIR